MNNRERRNVVDQERDKTTRLVLEVASGSVSGRNRGKMVNVEQLAQSILIRSRRNGSESQLGCPFRGFRMAVSHSWFDHPDGAATRCASSMLSELTCVRHSNVAIYKIDLF